MQSANQKSVDPYVLNRNLAATARLNLQHYIWKEEFGYLVHPDIPIHKEDITIADVGTGTGIWLLDLAQNLPASARLQGLDISLDQTPPAGWLPSNVSFHHFNVFENVPEDLVEKFDVVHVRHLVLVIKDNEPLPVLQQLLKLLKPGGYLQWGEVNLLSRKTVQSSPTNSSEKLKQLQDEAQELMHAPYSSWPAKLGDAYKAQGLINISTSSTWTREPYLSFVQANNLLIYEELTNRAPPDKKEHFRRLYAEAVAESRQGVAWNIERLITIGQKARPGTD